MTMSFEKDSRARVLLVEDEVLICDLAAEAFAEQGFEVQAVPDADQALQYLKSGQPFDILFTDVDLPGGMDGASLAQRARELRPNLPVMYTSGNRPMIDRMAPVTGSMFVPKPYNPFDLGRLFDYLIAARCS